MKWYNEFKTIQLNPKENKQGLLQWNSTLTVVLWKPKILLAK